MNFREASEIAKQYPGATISRDQFGGFIVRDHDGTLLHGITDDEEVLEPAGSGRPKADELQEECKRLRKNLDETKRLLYERTSEERRLQTTLSSLGDRQYELQSDLSSLRDRNKKLRGSVTREKSRAEELQQKLEELESKNLALKTKIEKVSDSEWARIAEDERIKREAEAAERRAERQTIRCPCSGEVENCIRCDGAGQYTIDGFGNRV